MAVSDSKTPPLLKEMHTLGTGDLVFSKLRSHVLALVNDVVSSPTISHELPTKAQPEPIKHEGPRSGGASVSADMALMQKINQLQVELFQKERLIQELEEREMQTSVEGALVEQLQKQNHDLSLTIHQKDQQLEKLRIRESGIEKLLKEYDANFAKLQNQLSEIFVTFDQEGENVKKVKSDHESIREQLRMHQNILIKQKSELESRNVMVKSLRAQILELNSTVDRLSSALAASKNELELQRQLVDKETSLRNQLTVEKETLLASYERSQHLVAELYSRNSIATADTSVPACPTLPSDDTLKMNQQSDAGCATNIAQLCTNKEASQADSGSSEELPSFKMSSRAANSGLSREEPSSTIECICGNSQAGTNLVECSRCSRVYHGSCVSGTSSDLPNSFICADCRANPSVATKKRRV